MNYQHIIFDLDGTLINPEKGIKDSLLYAVNKMNISFDLDSQFRDFIGPPLHDGFMKVLSLNDREADLAVSYFREYYGSKGLYESKLYAGIPELISNLHKTGKKIYLATSKLEKYAVEILSYLEIDTFFSMVSGASYKGSGADKQHLIARVLMNIPQKEKNSVVMIGDTLFDIQGAQQTAISSIGVLYGYGNEADLMAAGADQICAAVSDLHTLLLN